MSHAASRYVKHLVQAPNGDTLTIAEKLVLSQLADDHNEDERRAWPSIPKLASRCMMTEKHCRNLLHRLELKGVLSSTPRLDKKGARLANWYRFPQIDPPFDKREEADTRKQLLLQAARRQQRPVQMQLTPPSPPGEGPPNPQVSPPLTSSGVPPSPPGEGPPNLQGRVPLTSRGGLELPVNYQGQPPLQLQPELPRELPGKTPPTPVAGGDEPSEVDRDSWSLFRAQLKRELYDVPLGLSRRFKEIRPGESDYNACFVDWFLYERREEAERVVLVTWSGDYEATAAGLQKYSARIAKLAKANFRGLKGRLVEFELRRVKQNKGIDLAASAESPPKRSGT